MMYAFLFALVLAGSGIAIVHAQDPEIVNDILPDVQRVGRTARLNCTVARLRDNSVQWAFKGDPEYIVSINQEIKTLNPRKGGIPRYQVVRTDDGGRITFQLVISRLRPEFSGTYECSIIVANPLVTHTNRKKGQLIVQFPPVIRPGSTTAVKMIEKGANATIQCDAYSVPAPNITWVRSDGRLLPNGKALSRGKTLVIRYADVAYAGVYRCVADNSIKPPAEALTQVYVYQTPTVRVLQDTVGQFPNGKMRARLDCIVQGFPVPTVHWEFHAGAEVRRLANSDKFMTTKQATDNQNLFNGEQWYTLEIKNIQAGDMGSYYCVGTNAKGSGRVLVTLFETPDCQGPQCYSLAAEQSGNGAELTQLRPLSSFVCLLLTVLLSPINVFSSFSS